MTGTSPTWIRFPDCAELVDGEVYTWTAKAAEVTWCDGPATYWTWAWSSAITRREEMMNRNLGERTNRDSSCEEWSGEWYPRRHPLAVRFDGRIWAVAAAPVHWFTRDA